MGVHVIQNQFYPDDVQESARDLWNVFFITSTKHEDRTTLEGRYCYLAVAGERCRTLSRVAGNVALSARDGKDVSWPALPVESTGWEPAPSAPAYAAKGDAVSRVGVLDVDLALRCTDLVSSESLSASCRAAS